MEFLGILIIVFLSSFAGTWLAKRYALTKQIIDIPNARSSHLLPTPRGGGITFVVVFLSAVIFFTYIGVLGLHISWLLFVSIAMVVVTSFYDDRRALSPLLRGIVQLAAACLVIYAFKPLPNLNLYIIKIPSGVFMDALIALYIVWLLNLYNFMDGINGIASIEALTVCCGMIIIYWLNGNLPMAFLSAILFASVLGFLPWNFPKAKIFMGDVGSSFLGFVLVLFSLEALTIQQELFWSCLVLLGVFIVDASVTLWQRVISGEKLYIAHCRHAYQHAARKYNSHTPVTFGVLIINMVWLLPIAILISLHYINSFLGLLLAYIPLFLLAAKFKAGRA